MNGVPKVKQTFNVYNAETWYDTSE